MRQIVQNNDNVTVNTVSQLDKMRHEYEKSMFPEIYSDKNITDSQLPSQIDDEMQSKYKQIQNNNVIQSQNSVSNKQNQENDDSEMESDESSSQNYSNSDQMSPQNTQIQQSELPAQILNDVRQQQIVSQQTNQINKIIPKSQNFEIKPKVSTQQINTIAINVQSCLNDPNQEPVNNLVEYQFKIQKSKSSSESIDYSKISIKPSEKTSKSNIHSFPQAKSSSISLKQKQEVDTLSPIIPYQPEAIKFKESESKKSENSVANSRKNSKSVKFVKEESIDSVSIKDDEPQILKLEDELNDREQFISLSQANNKANNKNNSNYEKQSPFKMYQFPRSIDNEQQKQSPRIPGPSTKFQNNLQKIQTKKDEDKLENEQKTDQVIEKNDSNVEKKQEKLNDQSPLNIEQKQKQEEVKQQTNEYESKDILPPAHIILKQRIQRKKVHRSNDSSRSQVVGQQDLKSNNSSTQNNIQNDGNLNQDQMQMKKEELDKMERHKQRTKNLVQKLGQQLVNKYDISLAAKRQQIFNGVIGGANKNKNVGRDTNSNEEQYSDDYVLPEYRKNARRRTKEEMQALKAYNQQNLKKFTDEMTGGIKIDFKIVRNQNQNKK